MTSNKNQNGNENKVPTAEVRRFLESAGEALLECKRIARRVEQLSLRCEKLVRSEGVGNPSETLRELWRLLEEERVRETEAVRYEMRRYREVEDFIAALPDPTARTILRRRYLDGDTTWVRICFRLERDGVYYSERQVYRLYEQAMATAASLFRSKQAVSA